jgi:hypothetical protein
MYVRCAQKAQFMGHGDARGPQVTGSSRWRGLARGDFDKAGLATAGAGRPLLGHPERRPGVAPQARWEINAAGAPARGPTGFSQERAERALGFRAPTDFRTGLTRYLTALRQEPD